MEALCYCHPKSYAKLTNEFFVHIEIEGDDSLFMQQTANKIIEMIGEPRNYGMSDSDCALWQSGTCTYSAPLC